MPWYRSLNANTSVKFVNTSMHGVSDPFATRAFEVFGLPPFVPVKEQQAPDPDFPTVRFPNPEEKGTRTGIQASISHTKGWYFS